MKTIIEPKDFNKELESYCDADAQIWLYNVTHKRLAIRLSKPDKLDVLYIIAIACEYIAAPFSWKNANLSINCGANEFGEKTFTLIDKVVGLELICTGGVSLAKGVATELDNSFETFLND